MSSKTKIILVFLLLVLSVLVLTYLYKRGSDYPPANTENNSPQGEVEGSGEKVEVTQTNITGGGTSKLPEGFPAGIPVETINIKESYKVDYNDRGVTQYTISYSSMKSIDDVWTIYFDFMNKERYMIDMDATSRSSGQITGFLGNDSLSIVISAQNGGTLVQMNLLARQ